MAAADIEVEQGDRRAALAREERGGLAHGDRRFESQWKDRIEDRWEYADFLQDAGWRRDWISFDCLCHDPTTDTVFCGITSFDADIFWGWRRKERQWFDCGYGRVRDRYDAKFHRSLLRRPQDGCLYAALALAPDGRAYGVTGRDGECELLQFEPRSGRWTLLGPVADPATGERPWQIHDLCVTPDGTLFAGENDNPTRSGYLWEIRL